MEQLLKEAIESGTNYYYQMNFVAYSNTSKREYSFQGPVYHLMPDLWPRKIFPGFAKGNSNIPEKHVRMMSSNE